MSAEFAERPRLWEKLSILVEAIIFRWRRHVYMYICTYSCRAPPTANFRMLKFAIGRARLLLFLTGFELFRERSAKRADAGLPGRIGAFRGSSASFAVVPLVFSDKSAPLVDPLALAFTSVWLLRFAFPVPSLSTLDLSFPLPLGSSDVRGVLFGASAALVVDLSVPRCYHH